MTPRLPITDVLPDVVRALRTHGRAVLQAPPGVGKTTGVPLALLEADPDGGRILMLEPRRLAARAAATRMADVLGEDVGGRVGYRIRGGSRVGKSTRIEVVTEGILTRILQNDPELPGIGTVIFDEFHERSLNADLGLALTWEARATLREDLRVLVMSATLDAGPVAAMLDDAPVITAEGRAFPVETRHLPRPLPSGTRVEVEAARLTQQALSETDGGVLVFLPGAGEIHRCARYLEDGLPGNVDLFKLFGAASAKDQRAALAPAPKGRRKLVLATAIAETSLASDGIRVVVDAGLARRARFDPGSGMSRLVTERVSRAEADQRRGRAGRIAPGVAYRMWARAEEGALPAFAPPEIVATDLAGLALDLATWGSAPDDLAFLTPPPEAALANARALLTDLGALDADGRITGHGRALARLPLHPRLAHMLTRAGKAAAPLAALLGDTDPLRGPGASPDLDARLSLVAGRSDPRADAAALARIKVEAKRLARMVPDAAPPEGPDAPGAMAALAYPDRIGKRRSGDTPRWVMSGGQGAAMDPGAALATAPFLVALNTDGARPEARIRLAARLSEEDIRALYADRILRQRFARWSRRLRQVEARDQERFGALVLSDKAWKDAPPEAITRALMDGVRDLGMAALNLSPAAERLRSRVGFVRAQGSDLPSMEDVALLETLDIWLAQHVARARQISDLAGRDLFPALQAMLDWPAQQMLDRLAPAGFSTPLGRNVAIDYGGGVASATVRLQELFGLTTHPVVGPAHLPLTLTLTSPAGRPLQVTSDLPGFWASSYADVRKDMRGRYPKHPWPEDPTKAAPTTRVKPRKP